MKNRLFTFSILLLVGTTACNLEKGVDIDLPVAPAQLVLECYLEPGEVPQLTVSETVPYLAPPTPVVPAGVQVVLTGPGGFRETLRNQPGINPATQKVYTHRGRQPLNARPGDVFSIEVTDSKGRRLTGQATMPRIVPIDTVEWKFNDLTGDQRRANLLIRFQDQPDVPNFYRLQIHQDSISDDPNRDFELDDRLQNGQKITLGTSFRYAANDTLLVTLYHLDQPYYLFLQSVRDARNANGNPFAQPAAVKSTVQGGLGVFTILSYRRKTIIVR
ncbi:DUF4249 domain-containing protein [Hymenobacter sp. BT175]|uniref:DUF4249 domain-containing protein n=1 Tax=Hymenobacter translucens TaxID=2886507 RepID=UPI001D0F0B71|nr:DUF4249 domain-containing protein [Hymenobacter translucens]MCC2548082.1 DUF4249 domain-containing protein [Hymenobacter translucens]